MRPGQTPLVSGIFLHHAQGLRPHSQRQGLQLPHPSTETRALQEVKAHSLNVKFKENKTPPFQLTIYLSCRVQRSARDSNLTSGVDRNPQQSPAFMPSHHLPASPPTTLHRETSNAGPKGGFDAWWQKPHLLLPRVVSPPPLTVLGRLQPMKAL